MIAVAAGGGKTLELRRIGIQHRHMARLHDLAEQPALGGEVGFAGAVIVQVIAREIGEGGRCHLHAIEAKLVEAVG